MPGFRTFALPKNSSPSPSSSSSFSSDYSPTSSSSSSSLSSSDVEKVNDRSEKLTRLLKQNVRKSHHRKAVLDTLKDKAWLLDDQVKLFMKETANLKESFARRSWRRILCIGMIILALVYIILSIPEFIKWLIHSKNYDSEIYDSSMKGRFYAKPSGQFGRYK